MIKENNQEDNIKPFKVYVRVRPLLEKELNQQEGNPNDILNNKSAKISVIVEDHLVCYYINICRSI